MPIRFDYRPHPQIAARTRTGPPRTVEEHVGPNGKLALVLTRIVGTMWCAYAFALLAFVALPQAIQGGLLPIVQWISQTFIQLVMLSVIMVGQNVLGRASDKRAVLAYNDAEATLHETEQIQAHLRAQDEAINALLAKIERLDAVGDEG